MMTFGVGTYSIQRMTMGTSMRNRYWRRTEDTDWRSEDGEGTGEAGRKRESPNTLGPRWLLLGMVEPVTEISELEDGEYYRYKKAKDHSHTFQVDWWPEGEKATFHYRDGYVSNVPRENVKEQVEAGKIVEAEADLVPDHAK
jgi:hypothetical protein